LILNLFLEVPNPLTSSGGSPPSPAFHLPHLTPSQRRCLVSHAYANYSELEINITLLAVRPRVRSSPKLVLISFRFIYELLGLQTARADYFVKQGLNGKFPFHRMVRSLPCSADVMPSFRCASEPVVAEPQFKPVLKRPAALAQYP
jgi:hypothetical protein